MLALASRHTAVDSAVLRQTFQPVYTVIPAGEAEQFINEGNGAYVGALGALQSAMTQARS